MRIKLITDKHYYYFIWAAFGNSRMLTDLKQARNKPVPNAGTKSVPREDVP